MESLDCAVRVGPSLVLAGVFLLLTVGHLQPPVPVTVHRHDCPVREGDSLHPGDGDGLAGAVREGDVGLPRDCPRLLLAVTELDDLRAVW